jgi:hypothetical protein
VGQISAGANTSFWTDSTGRALRKAGPEVQLVALYLLSSAHCNYISLYPLPIAYACADLGMSEKALMAAIATVETTGFMKFDRANEIVWIVEGAGQQIGDLKYSPKSKSAGTPDTRIACVRREFAQVPKASPLRAEFFAKYAEMLKLDQDVALAVKPTPPKQISVPVAAAAKTQSLEEQHYATALKTFMAQREAQRDVFLEGGDSSARATAQSLVRRTNWPTAAALLGYAIVANDLNLVETQDHVPSESATQWKAIDGSGALDI